ncbi:TolC family protein [Chryseolinea sp. T2]|uniref:TolC family protein n=1 Tax=Chryseolinea sp. T2 TaxID=3129255 RepID=UPI003077440C
MRYLSAVAVGCSLLLNSLSGIAQDNSIRVLSFKDAVKLGMQNNLALTQQRNQLEYTEINKTSTLLQMGPSVQGNWDLYRTDGNSFNPNEGQVVNGVIDYVGGSVSASMPVFTGFGMLNTHRAAKNANEAQLHQVVRSTQDVMRDVSNQYLACLRDRELIKVADENVRTQQATYDQISEQARLGAKAEADMVNQEYLLRNAELLLLRAQNTFKNDKATLAVTIGTDPATFDVGEVDWDINAQIQDSTTLEEMYKVAADRRSDLKQASYAERSFQFGYAATRGRWFPNAYANIQYGSRYNYVQGEDNRSFHDQFYTDNTQLNYGVSITIPIWNGLLTRAQAASTRMQYRNATIRRKNVEVVVKSDVLLAYQNFADARSNYKTSQSQLRAAELAYRMEKERYDLGISNIVQLSTVNQTYVKAQGDMENARFGLMFQRILIDYAMGTLQMEDIP